jgi:plasmid stabilization system protein ParE
MDCLLGDAQRAPRAQKGMTLQWSPESIHDLIALRAHIAEHDPAAAKRVALHILYCVEHLLVENPKLGAPGRVPGTRELVIPDMPLMAYSPLGGPDAGLLRDLALARFGAARGCSAAAVALAWTIRNGKVIAIPESGSAAHVKDNAVALALTLTPEELEALDAAHPPLGR